MEFPTPASATPSATPSAIWLVLGAFEIQVVHVDQSRIAFKCKNAMWIPLIVFARLCMVCFCLIVFWVLVIGWFPPSSYSASGSVPTETGTKAKSVPARFPFAFVPLPASGGGRG